MIDKINSRTVILAMFSIIHLLVNYNVLAQEAPLNKYGLHVVKDAKVLQGEANADSNKKMIDVKKMIPSLQLDLRYTTKNNFMHRRLYPVTRTTYLRRPAVEALQKVAAELKTKNLYLKIFDAYRPYSITEQMWEAVRDNRYAADPSNGSGHNRGVAVDLTLMDLQSKKELNMGTGFDNFSDTAHQDFMDLAEDVLQNRHLLKSIMEKYGFKSLETEWWHFSLPDANKYELLDVSFADLKKLNSPKKKR